MDLWDSEHSTLEEKKKEQYTTSERYKHVNMQRIGHLGAQP